jgi:corrinoid protein of di/trimethylamine methyltransferase
MTSKETLDRLIEEIIHGNQDQAREAAEASLAAGIDPLEIIQQGTTKALQVVGRKFSDFEIFLPELIMAAEAANAAMSVILPQIAAEERKEATGGRVVIATVSGDLHDIGKNLVSAVLSAAGFEVHDLGVDVPSRQIANAARDLNADIIALSSLLTTSMQFQKDVVEYVTEMGLRERLFIIVGGGPVTPEWASEIRADGYGRRAPDAAELCRQLMAGERRPPLPDPVIVSG